MIELRWFTHKSVPFQDTMGIAQIAAGKTVLQYRVKEATFNDSGVQTGYGWTDWQDVPTEAE